MLVKPILDFLSFEGKLNKHVVNPQAVRPSGISPESGSKVDERKKVKKSQQSATSGKPLQNGASRTSGERYSAQTVLIRIPFVLPVLFG